MLIHLNLLRLDLVEIEHLPTPGDEVHNILIPLESDVTVIDTVAHPTEFSEVEPYFLPTHGIETDNAELPIELDKVVS